MKLLGVRCLFLYLIVFLFLWCCINVGANGSGGVTPEMTTILEEKKKEIKDVAQKATAAAEKVLKYYGEFAENMTIFSFLSREVSAGMKNISEKIKQSPTTDEQKKINC